MSEDKITFVNYKSYEDYVTHQKSKAPHGGDYIRPCLKAVNYGSRIVGVLN